MIKSKRCFGDIEVVDFLNSLEKKGYSVVMTVVSIAQMNGYYTVFYKYLKDLEDKGL